MKDNFQLNYTTYGNPYGKPLIISHGWATDSSFTLPIAKKFANRKVILLDFPGYGLNYHIKEINPYSLEFIQSLHQSLPLKCDILAWSLSSLLAIKLCNFDKGNKIDKLVTICGTARFPADPNWPGFSGHYVMQTKKVFTKIRFKKLLRLFYALQCQSSLNSKENNLFLKQASNNMKIPNFEVLERGLEAMADMDLRLDLFNLKQPCLHLFGAYDKLVPAKLAFILKKYPRHEVFIFEKSGHMPFLTEPEKFFNIVNNFLK